MIKVCTKCLKPKADSEFHNRKHSKDGLRYECKACSREQNKAYELANPEKCALQARTRFFRQHTQIYARINARFAANPLLRVVSGLRKRTAEVLRGERTQLKYLGCSPEFLRFWLELQFQANMTWANYGQWHVDHKKPCARFDLGNEEQRMLCFHYSNLQPLWALENLRKGAK